MSVMAVIKTVPRVARDLTGSGALPSVENLINKSPDQLIQTLGRFGIEPDLASIDRRAQKAFVNLSEMLADGKMPSDAAFERLGKQHEQEMTAALRQMTKQAIRLYKDKLTGSGPDTKEVWITSGGDNVCPDCEPLHGQIKTHAQWVALGLPGTRKHVCGLDCNCQLLPA